VRNTIFCLILFVSLFVFFACGGSPQPAPAPAAPSPAPAPTPAPPQPAPTPAATVRTTELILEGADTYTVVSRDTLSKISKRTYKNGFYYPLIMMASKDIVKDQDLIKPGMVLTIPKLQVNLDDARARESIKKFFSEIANITDRKRPADAAGLRKLVREMP